MAVKNKLKTVSDINMQNANVAYVQQLMEFWIGFLFSFDCKLVSVGISQAGREEKKNEEMLLQLLSP